MNLFTSKDGHSAQRDKEQGGDHRETARSSLAQSGQALCETVWGFGRKFVKLVPRLAGSHNNSHSSSALDSDEIQGSFDSIIEQYGRQVPVFIELMAPRVARAAEMTERIRAATESLNAAHAKKQEVSARVRELVQAGRSQEARSLRKEFADCNREIAELSEIRSSLESRQADNTKKLGQLQAICALLTERIERLALERSETIADIIAAQESRATSVGSTGNDPLAEVRAQVEAARNAARVRERVEQIKAECQAEEDLYLSYAEDAASATPVQSEVEDLLLKRARG